MQLKLYTIYLFYINNAKSAAKQILFAALNLNLNISFLNSIVGQDRF